MSTVRVVEEVLGDQRPSSATEAEFHADGKPSEARSAWSGTSILSTISVLGVGLLVGRMARRALISFMYLSLS